MPFNIVVMGSGFGSSFRSMLPILENEVPNATVALVLSNKSEAPILHFAKYKGLTTDCILSKGLSRQAFDEHLHDTLIKHRIDLVVLTGFMRILTAWFVEHWPKKIINVHPSLLPRHKGLMDLAVHQAVIDAKESQSGCSVHLVTERVDEGPVLAQLTCDVSAGCHAQKLKEKVQALEGRALVNAIQKMMEG